MAENLKTTHYNDSTSIPYVSGAKTWFNLTTPAYYWYNNDVSNKSTSGVLYNWNAVNNHKLCPKGWHVPSKDEWNTLISNLGWRQYFSWRLFKGSRYNALGCTKYGGR